MGVYDQETINEKNTNPIIREGYQRLALLHFKVHVHLNSLLMTHFPQFKPFDYLTPIQSELRAEIRPAKAENLGHKSANDFNFTRQA
ncbi:hypothetical protein CEP53_001052 [Fusarium sp. AF-6]|nr:hypothetical protein CEP53_001052 [Fusarium sp. AF-6]